MTVWFERFNDGHDIKAMCHVRMDKRTWVMYRSTLRGRTPNELGRDYKLFQAAAYNIINRMN